MKLIPTTYNIYNWVLIFFPIWGIHEITRSTRVAGVKSWTLQLLRQLAIALCQAVAVVGALWGSDASKIGTYLLKDPIESKVFKRFQREKRRDQNCVSKQSFLLLIFEQGIVVLKSCWHQILGEWIWQRILWWPSGSVKRKVVARIVLMPKSGA